MRRERVQIQRARLSLPQPLDNNNRRSVKEVQRSHLNNKISLKHKQHQTLYRVLVDKKALMKVVRVKGKHMHRINRRPSSILAQAHQCIPIKMSSNIRAQISTPRFSS